MRLVAPQEESMLCGQDTGTSPQAMSLKAALKEQEGATNTIRRYELDTLLGTLLDMVSDCNVIGWDGEDAEPLPRAALADAHRIIEALPDDIPLPEIFPDPTGAVGLEWAQSKGRLCVARIDGGRKLIIIGLFDGEQPSETRTTVRFSETIPHELVDTLRRLYRVRG